MARGRFPLVRAVAILAALGVTLLVFARFGREAPADGEVWRRGTLGGEQVLLRRDGRYQVQRWRWYGAGQTLESGTWKQLGDVVSLVPSSRQASARLLRKSVRSGDWYLVDPSEPEAASPYERVD